MTGIGDLPHIGARVVAVDGEELGKVKEVSQGCFRVDVGLQPGYWLGTDLIASIIGNEVRLRFTKGGLAGAPTGGFDHRGLHPHP